MFERREDDEINTTTILSNDTFSQENDTCLKIIFNSLVLFTRNKRVFSFIFTLTVLPLSILRFTLFFSCHAVNNHVYSLEALARYALTPFEAGHVLEESRAEVLSLLRLKLLYFLPSYSLSLLAAITTVTSTYYGCSADATGNRRFTLHNAIAFVRLTWKRPLVTSICIYVMLALYGQLFFVLAVITGNNSLSTGPTLFALRAVGWGLQVYIMAVLGLGLVVSVLEDRFGLDAIRVASSLMEGRAVCGWLLSVWSALLSEVIGWSWEELMDGLDSTKEKKWSGSWEKVGALICLHGVEVMWSYVVTTLLYRGCRKRRQVIQSEEDTNLIIV